MDEVRQLNAKHQVDNEDVTSWCQRWSASTRSSTSRRSWRWPPKGLQLFPSWSTVDQLVECFWGRNWTRVDQLVEFAVNLLLNSWLTLLISWHFRPQSWSIVDQLVESIQLVDQLLINFCHFGSQNIGSKPLTSWSTVDQLVEFIQLADQLLSNKLNAFNNVEQQLFNELNAIQQS